jgi:diacylglycerol kinase (ATP)
VRSLALLSNPESGSGEASELPQRLRGLGAEVGEFEIGQFDEAASSGAERVVVAGGDGSIAPAARACSRHEIPMAVIPAGTANDFARAHELPLDIEEACRLAVSGERAEPIDVALMGDRPFLNVASLGLPPAAAEKAHGLKGLLGPLAYAIGAARAGVSAPSLHCRVLCNDEEWFSGSVWQVTVACSGAFGGGSSVEADPADGRLDLVVIEANSRLRLLHHAYGLRTGGIEGQTGVRSHRCRTLRIEPERETDFNVDGELVSAAATSFSVEARAVDLITG